MIPKKFVSFKLGFIGLILFAGLGCFAVAILIPKLGQRKIAPSGGEFFNSRLVIPVPHFCQGDESWGEDKLGPTEATMSQEGCAVASAAMVLSYYGVETDPGRLNQFLLTNGGYTEKGWIYWEKAGEIVIPHIEKAYEWAPFYFLIDWNLKRGNPVIARLRYPGRSLTHFVVIVGKEGYDYLILDPGRNKTKGVYPLREFGSDIEALRFYTKPKSA